jgi:hypothetical protein
MPVCIHISMGDTPPTFSQARAVAAAIRNHLAAGSMGVYRFIVQSDMAHACLLLLLLLQASAWHPDAG